METSTRQISLAPRHPMFGDYLVHCRNSLLLYGDGVYATLGSKDHFCTWLREEKAKDPDVSSVFVNSWECRTPSRTIKTIGPQSTPLGTYCLRSVVSSSAISP